MMILQGHGCSVDKNGDNVLAVNGDGGGDRDGGDAGDVNDDGVDDGSLLNDVARCGRKRK